MNSFQIFTERRGKPAKSWVMLNRQKEKTGDLTKVCANSAQNLSISNYKKHPEVENLAV